LETGELGPLELETGEQESIDLETGEQESIELETGESDSIELETDELGPLELETGELETGELGPLELETGEQESIELETGELETGEQDSVELETGGLDELDLSAVDFSGETSETAEIPLLDEPLEELALPGEEELSLVDLSEVDLGDDSPETAITLEENTGIEEGSEEFDISLNLDESLDTALTEEESIALEGFDENALDLTGAVIDEPDLGAEIQENPLLEPAPADIAVLDEGLVEDIAPLPPEPPAAVPVEDIEDETEIAKSEESAAEIPAVRGNISRGEDLDQIIPEGFIVEDLDEEMPEGFGGAGLDTLEEGISLDEIPEDVLPEDEAPVALSQIETVEEPEVSGLPGNFRQELKNVLSYMDQLLESLPEDKIEEFARSEYFDTYKKLFKDLGLA
jgi:hypothetical protein